jgi:CheY-like chemotaxis protein
VPKSRPLPHSNLKLRWIILVVEDDEDVRAHTCSVIAELGYTVLQAANGKEALAVIDQNPQIDLLFTDVGLAGGMNGRQLAENARKRRKDLKTLFTTGYAKNAIVHDGRLDPGVSLITKPFEYAVLSERLRDLLDSRPASSVVLIVEDEVLIQLVAAEHLDELGLKSEVVGSAADAKSKLQLFDGAVAVAIVDVGLPDATGDDLIRELRTIYPSIPMIIASGYDMSVLRDRLRNLDRIEYLAKPYTLETMKACLKALGVIYSGSV